MPTYSRSFGTLYKHKSPRIVFQAQILLDAAGGDLDTAIALHFEDDNALLQNTFGADAGFAFAGAMSSGGANGSGHGSDRDADRGAQAHALLSPTSHLLSAAPSSQSSSQQRQQPSGGRGRRRRAARGGRRRNADETDAAM
eukprot:6206657-Pleurochrysis_carterae.AAC.1